LEPNFDKIVIGWSSSKIVSGGPALWPRWPPQCSFGCGGPSWSKGRTAVHIFGREPSNDYFIKILFLLSDQMVSDNYWANLNQTLLKWFLGGPLPKLCSTFQNTEQDGRHHRTWGHPRIIPQKFGCNWPSGFWGEDSMRISHRVLC
jgi:hypothetical protein